MRCGGKTPKMPPGLVAIMEDHSGSRCRRRPALISSPTSHVGSSTTPMPATAASRSGSESSARKRIDQTIVLQQVARLGNRRRAVQIGLARAGNAPVRRELAGEQAGIDERTDTDRQVGADGQEIDSYIGQRDIETNI